MKISNPGLFIMQLAMILYLTIFYCYKYKRLPKREKILIPIGLVCGVVTLWLSLFIKE